MFKGGKKPSQKKRILELEQLVQNLVENATPAKKGKRKRLTSTITDYFGFDDRSPQSKKLKQDREYSSSAELRKEKKSKHEEKRDKEKMESDFSSPSITPFSLSDKMIKDRTGFVNEAAMLNFITIVCNGDFEIMKTTESSLLTWYEE